MQYNTVLHRCQICWTLVLGRIQGYCTDSTEHPLASLHSSQCACCCCCSNKTYDLDREPTANTLALTMRNFIIFQYHALLTHFNVLKTLVQIDGVIIRCSYFLANFDTVTWIISSYLSYGRVALLVWTVFVPSVKSHNFSNLISELWNIKLLLIIKPSSVNFK